MSNPTKKLLLLGATGSIGTQTLTCIPHVPGVTLVGVACNDNITSLQKIISQHPTVQSVYIHDHNHKEILKKAHPQIAIFDSSNATLQECIHHCDFDIALNAISGGKGIHSSIAILEKGKPLLLANKESLVVAGPYLQNLAHTKGVPIIPVDSEHSALADLLSRCNQKEISQVYLTASGGPFWGKSFKKEPSLKEVLQHPIWSMGKKISVDSATMMNKGLEVIEAHYLFDIPYEKIQVVVHPASLVHAMVATKQGSVLSYMSPPDMKIPIFQALSHPQKYEWPFSQGEFFCPSPQDFVFMPPDREKFPLIELAYYCGKRGGTAPAALNAANDRIVSLFLKGEILFSQIPNAIQQLVEKHHFISQPTLEDLFCVVESIQRENISS